MRWRSRGGYAEDGLHDATWKLLVDTARFASQGRVEPCAKLLHDAGGDEPYWNDTTERLYIYAMAALCDLLWVDGEPSEMEMRTLASRGFNKWRKMLTASEDHLFATLVHASATREQEDLLKLAVQYKIDLPHVIVAIASICDDVETQLAELRPRVAEAHHIWESHS